MAKQNLEPLLGAAQNQLAITVSDSDSIDTKTLGILGLNIALGIFVLQSAIQGHWTLFAILYGTLGLSTLITLIIIWPHARHNQYAGAVVDLKEYPGYMQLAEDDLVAQLLADTEWAIKTNLSKNAFKKRLCTYSVTLSLVGIAALVGCIL